MTRKTVAKIIVPTIVVVAILVFSGIRNPWTRRSHMPQRTSRIGGPRLTDIGVKQNDSRCEEILKKKRGKPIKHICRPKEDICEIPLMPNAISVKCCSRAGEWFGHWSKLMTSNPPCIKEVCVTGKYLTMVHHLGQYLGDLLGS